MSAAIFEQIGATLAADPAAGKKLGGSILFVLTGGSPSERLIDGKAGQVSRGKAKADCTITISDDNFAKLVAGTLNGMQVQRLPPPNSPGVVSTLTFPFRHS